MKRAVAVLVILSGVIVLFGAKAGIGLVPIPVEGMQARVVGVLIIIFGIYSYRSKNDG